MEVLELILSNISEAVPISKCRGLFPFNSYIRGFHAYKQSWDPVLGRRYSYITEVDTHVFLILSSKYFFVRFTEVDSGRNSRAGPGKCPL